MMNIGGVYEILNTVNGKRYIGSSINLGKRFAHHKRALTKGYHENPKLQHAWNKHGASAFEFRPVMLCLAGGEREWEQRYLSEFKPEYNIALHASAPMAGRKHSAGSLAKLSVSLKGRIFTPEHKANMSVAATNRSQEHRYRLGARNRGKVMPVEQRNKISITLTGKPGHPQSQATRDKISRGRTGKHLGPLSDEHRLKISKTMTGRKGPPCLPATREKISKTKTGAPGHPQTQETRDKIAAKTRIRMADPQARKATGDINRGKPMSQAAKDNLSRIRTGMKCPAVAEANRRRAKKPKQ